MPKTAKTRKITPWQAFLQDFDPPETEGGQQSIGVYSKQAAEAYRTLSPAQRKTLDAEVAAMNKEDVTPEEADALQYASFLHIARAMHTWTSQLRRHGTGSRAVSVRLVRSACRLGWVDGHRGS